MKKFFKKYGKKIILFVVITAATIAAYIAAHEFATFERGYEAIGGEMFIPLLPALIWLIAPDFAAPFKAVKDNELD